MNTHSHFDHSSGLRTCAAEGVTIVTHPGNIPYYEQLWAGPRTITPDRLARSGRKRGVVNLVHFYQAVERLRLEVEQSIPIHGRLVTMDDLRAAATSFGNRSGSADAGAAGAVAGRSAGASALAPGGATRIFQPMRLS